MNLETIKKNITTANKIYDKRNEYPIDLEFTLPDFCPDIERILKCNIIPRITNLSVLSDTAQIDISVNICVLYATKEDKLFGYELTSNLSKSINVGMVDFETIKSYSIKPEYVNCRAINNRKIDVHGAASVMLKLEAKEDKKYICEVVDETVVVRKQNCEVLTLIGSLEKSVNVADDVILNDSQGSVSNIIKNDVCVVVDEIKTITNKAVVKMTVNYDILYISSDMRYEKINKSVSISQVLDMPGVRDDSILKINANLCSASFKAVTNSEGEMRTINASAKINILACCYSLTSVSAVTDGYSVKYESDLERDTIGCEKFITSLNDNIAIREHINVSSQISEIIDMRLIPLHYTCKNENDSTYISGDVAVCVSLEDENGSCKYYEKVVTYNEKLPENISEDGCNFDFVLTPKECSYNITSGNCIEFKCEMNVNGLVVKPFSLNAVTAINVDEQNKKSFDDMPSLVVYFGEKGESIWDIALKYNTSFLKVQEANDINDEILKENKMLLIPCM